MPMPAGSIFMYDARLLHRGGANVSTIVRPIIYITYQRPWYQERSGYVHKPQIRVTQAMLARMAPTERDLFAWALHLNRTDSLFEFLMLWVGRIKSRLGGD
jgi:ectoine hydroxylase-related dioxygenase (phytanoyl-CoA dioxygenase family)